MKHRTLGPEAATTHVLVMDEDEEVTATLLAFARAQDITAGHFTAIGELSEVVLGFFDFDRKDYHRIPVNEQVEVASLTGNFAEEDRMPALHCHLVLTDRNGMARGGHLLSARVPVGGTSERLHRCGSAAGQPAQS